MDKASAYGAGDCRFESCRGHFVALLPSLFLGRHSFIPPYCSRRGECVLCIHNVSMKILIFRERIRKGTCSSMGIPLHHVDVWALCARYVQGKAARHGEHLHPTQRFLKEAHARNRTRATSMGGLYNTATLRALVSQNHGSWSTFSLAKI